VGLRTSSETPPVDWPEVDETEYQPMDAGDLNAAVGEDYGDGIIYIAQTQVQGELGGGLGSSAEVPDDLDRYGTAAAPLGDNDAVILYVPGTVANAEQLDMPFTVAQIVPAGSADAARENLETVEETLTEAGVDDVVLLGEDGDYEGHPGAPGARFTPSGTIEGEGVLEGALISYRLVEPGVYEVRVYWDRDEPLPTQQDVYAVAAMEPNPAQDPITGEIVHASVDVYRNILKRGLPPDTPDLQ
jgi:hypothetical protein